MPGLGFLHLSTAAAQVGRGGVRGAPRGERVASEGECCSLCAKRADCTVWMHRPEAGTCYLGNCSAASLPCLERSRAGSQSTAQPRAGVPMAAASHEVAAGRRVLLCARPQLPQAGRHGSASGRSLAANAMNGRRAPHRAIAARPLQRALLQQAHAGGEGGAAAADGAQGEGLAVLLLGHRARLMLSTLPAHVVAPAVRSGVGVDVFAFLENSTMAKAFRGRRPMGHPALAGHSDEELSAHIRREVDAAGGQVIAVQIGPRPLVRLPAELPQRLSRYSEGVKMTVATRFLKERLGLEMVLGHERTRRLPYAWLLWTREDSHWFAPLDLSRFARGAVHGKACGGFGGWNDKVWLMDRRWAVPMLSMYDDFHTPAPARCTDLGARDGARQGGGASVERPAASSEPRHVLVDYLAAPSVEQFRERVGKLHRVPFVKHPPEDLPTIDSYYARARDADAEGTGNGWRLCFPRIYAHGCVPQVNQSAVDAMSCA